MDVHNRYCSNNDDDRTNSYGHASRHHQKRTVHCATSLGQSSEAICCDVVKVVLGFIYAAKASEYKTYVIDEVLDDVVDIIGGSDLAKMYEAVSLSTVSPASGV